MCAHLKTADSRWLPGFAVRVWLETLARGYFATTFGAGVVLVPVPGSAPAKTAPWVGERLAWCLKELGLAAQVRPLLQRRHAVRKSAFAPAGARPSVLEHYASFAVERDRLDGMPPTGGERMRLTLVDDVITRGRTLLAAAGRLRELFPSAEIRAFALLRTLGRTEPLERLLDPCEGEVRWVSGDARRIP
ncbi:MAG TPA: phosphoribosyltransferase [Steroidobacteraceae bacterium]|nr:phosphoribosyltransferase [Steroidobacteraceae bacterium]